MPCSAMMSDNVDFARFRNPGCVASMTDTSCSLRLKWLDPKTFNRFQSSELDCYGTRSVLLPLIELTLQIRFVNLVVDVGAQVD